MSEPPFVSVIIPAYNDAARLGECLQALERQTYPRDRFEVIVGDNGSEPPLAPQLRGSPWVRVIRETKPGSYAARNAAVLEARGEVLAFTDSDCLPDEGWLEAGTAAVLRLGDLGLVGGRVQLFVADQANPTAVELYEKVLAFRQERNVRRDHFAVTANALTTRATFEQVGPFDAIMQSGGDREWGNRVHRAGLPVAYAQDAVVLHPARRSLGEISRKMNRVAHGHHLLSRRQPLPQRLLDWTRIPMPPFASLKEIWRTPELSGGAQRTRASAVALAAKYGWALARLRYAVVPEGSRSGEGRNGPGGSA